MKFLVAFTCLLAIATATPGYHGLGLAGHVAAPGFGYSSITAHAPVAVAHHAALAAPVLARATLPAAAPIAAAHAPISVAHHAAVAAPAIAHHAALAAPAIAHHAALAAPVAHHAALATPLAHHAALAAPLAHHAALAAPAIAHHAALAAPVAHHAALATPLAHHAALAAPVAHHAALAAPVAHHAALAAPLAHHAALAAPAIAHHGVVAAPALAHHGVLAAPVAVAAAIEKTQYHAQDAFGQASYGHNEAFQHHHAVQDAAGNKVGSYSWVAPSGQVIAGKYVADALGYRVHSNAIPVGPAPVGDTPEVVAARSAHFAAHVAAKSHLRVRRGLAVGAPAVAYTAAVATPLHYTAHYTSALVSPVVHSRVLRYGIW